MTESCQPRLINPLFTRGGEGWMKRLIHSVGYKMATVNKTIN